MDFDVAALHAALDSQRQARGLTWAGLARAAPPTLARATLPVVEQGRILRFDTRRVHAALDARRIERGMTWRQVADEIGGFGAASLTRLAKGGRASFPDIIRIARWLDLPVASLTHVSDR